MVYDCFHGMILSSKLLIQGWLCVLIFGAAYGLNRDHLVAWTGTGSRWFWNGFVPYFVVCYGYLSRFESMDFLVSLLDFE